jgi:D-glycero-D-manno-heptose 1,7-bisphosphate phosphatase
VRALFLDRDGVINVNHGHVGSKDRFEFIPGVFELVREANDRDYLVIVVTNQSGVARGFYTEQQFLDLSQWMREEFAKKGARIDRVYYCPHHPDAGQGEYKIRCDCRKPAAGMFFRAAAEHDIDLGASIFIGDNVTDFQAAKAAEIGRFLQFGAPSDKPGAISLHSLTDHQTIFG